jgi:hypothetical protein
MTTSRIVSLISLCLCSPLLAAEPDAAHEQTPKVEMRAPFVLTLHLDKEHYYEENIGEMPYVYENGIYLMKEDNFGVSLDIDGGKVRAVSYQPDLKKADMAFEFRQDVGADGSSMMMLIIRNRTTYSLQMNALMTVPGEKGQFETSIIPIQPGLTNYESWPHPIAKLLLYDVRTGT